MNNSVIFQFQVSIISYSKKRNKVHARPLPSHRPRKILVGVIYDNVGRVHKKRVIVF